MHPVESIASRIHSIRGLRVMVDADLAVLYGVETRTLLQAVRRNPERFPADFWISFSAQELVILRSQSVISKPQGRGGRRYATTAFTEHGAIMAATVLNSSRAIKVSVHVGTHDRSIGHILEALRQLTAPPEAQKRRRIGFQ